MVGNHRSSGVPLNIEVIPLVLVLAWIIGAIWSYRRTVGFEFS